MADFIEIGTPNAEAAKAFYAALFGWEFSDYGSGPGGLVRAGDRLVGLHEEDDPCVVPYLDVADIETSVAQVTDLGGTLMGQVTDAGELGRFATCLDPLGARFGLHQPT